MSEASTEWYIPPKSPAIHAPIAPLDMKDLSLSLHACIKTYAHPLPTVLSCNVRRSERCQKSAM